jgi:biopolymer transport protein TolR
MAKRAKVDTETEEGGDLNLTPFLDVMITLIPFLMLTASFFTVVVLEAKLPTPIKPETMQNVPMPPPFDLVIQVPKDSIKIYLNNKDPMGPPQFAIATPDTSYTDAQLLQFYNKMVEIKRQFPKEERLALDAHPSVKWEKITQIIDRARNLSSDDSAVKVFPDRRLFPNIAMKGVYVP